LPKICVFLIWCKSTNSFGLKGYLTFSAMDFFVLIRDP
jgi:hypothetical protein